MNVISFAALFMYDWYNLANSSYVWPNLDPDLEVDTLVM